MIDLESTLVVLSCWILNYLVPMRSDSSSLLLSLALLLCGDLLGPDDGVAKSDGSDVGRTWLQLMCCALLKCLCP